MHEYSVVRSLIDRVDAEAKTHGATAVHRVRVRIGELSGIEISLLRSAFEMARVQSLSDAAELEIVPVPARWGCPRCQAEVSQGQVLKCPLCEVPARLVAGADMFLESVELEVP